MNGPPHGGSRQIKLVVEYDGAAYHGWQRQAEGVPTVQAELERALISVVRHPITLQGASRTDAGVHALGQVASFETTSAVAADGIRRGANGALPKDVALRSVEEMPGEFNARFDARGKHYRYSVLATDTRRVFVRRWTHHHRGPLDPEAMQRAGRALEGTRDFAALANRSDPPPETTERTVHAIAVRRDGPIVQLDVIGRAFLYNMVRNIAGLLLEVGRGRRAPQTVGEVFESSRRAAAAPTLPAHGLCLVEVFYGEEDLREAVERCRRGESRGSWPADRMSPEW